MIMKMTFIKITLLIFALAACTPVPSYPPNDAAAAVQTAEFLVAQETSAANLQTATAAHATNQAHNATQAAVAAATGTAEAAQATGTAETMSVFNALEAEQTRLSISLTRDDATRIAGMNAAREAAAIEAEAIQNQDYAAELALQRQRELTQLQRQQTINNVLPWIYGGAFSLFLFVLLIVGMIVYRRLNPKVITPYPEPGQLSLPYISRPNMPLVITDGLSGVFHIPNSRPTIEADPAMQLPQQTTIDLANHGEFSLGHYLIAGETQGGKSTLGRFITQNWSINKIAVDPHYERGNWGNVDKVIGGGNNWQEIRSFFDSYMLPELDRRAKEKFDDPGATWPPVLVIIDEAPAIKSNIGKASSQTWAAWVRQGWKFGLFIMLVTQSTRVETLGIKGEKDVLRNFVYRFALGEVALEEYPGVADHLDRPAVIINKREARPVIIPNVTAESLRNSQPRESGLTTPLFVAPEPSGVTTSKGFVSQDIVDRVLGLHAGGESLRGIERQVFGTPMGQEGGANFYKIKEILEKVATASPLTISQNIR